MWDWDFRLNYKALKVSKRDKEISEPTYIRTLEYDIFMPPDLVVPVKLGWPWPFEV